MKYPPAPVNTAQRIGVLEKISYGLGDTASNIVFQTLLMFMAYYYTDVYGLSAAAMGTLFLVVRLVDAVTDPVMGALADRTETRWGKFRPYLLWLCVPYAVIAVLAFTTPNFGPTGKLIYAYVSYTLLMVVYTAINVPYAALGGVITANSAERVSLNSYRFFLATAGGVMVAAAMLPLVEWIGQGDARKGFPGAMAILAALAVLMFLACFLLTRERVRQVAEGAGSFRQDMRWLVANDQWRVVALISFVLLIPLVVRGSTAIYYMTWYVGRADLVSGFLTAGMLAAMVGAAFAGPLTKRLNITRSYVLLQGAVAVLSVAMYAPGKDQLALIFTLFLLVQFFGQMGSPILWTMMADTVDYSEWKTGRRTTGLVFSGTLFMLKLGMALGGALVGWMLAYFGYAADAATQTPETVHGIVVLFTLAPALGHLLVVLVASRYRLDQTRTAAIRAALETPPGAGNEGPT